MHKSDLNSEWLQRVLHERELLPAASAIAETAISPIGTGQVADSVRVVLTVDGEAPFFLARRQVVVGQRGQSRSR